jgi:hypothetical protein
MSHDYHKYSPQKSTFNKIYAILNKLRDMHISLVHINTYENDIKHRRQNVEKGIKTYRNF